MEEYIGNELPEHMPTDRVSVFGTKSGRVCLIVPGGGGIEFKDTQNAREAAIMILRVCDLWDSGKGR